MRKKEIDIIIDKDGNIEIDQIGWKGKSCEGAVDDLIKMLGEEVKSTRKKEWYQEKKVKIHQRRMG